jgi:hypothetical protein
VVDVKQSALKKDKAGAVKVITQRIFRKTMKRSNILNFVDIDVYYEEHDLKYDGGVGFSFHNTKTLLRKQHHNVYKDMAYGFVPASPLADGVQKDSLPTEMFYYNHTK